MICDRKALAWAVKKSYLRHNNQFQDLEGVLDLMIDEPWVMPRLQDTIANRYEARDTAVDTVAAVIKLKYHRQLAQHNTYLDYLITFMLFVSVCTAAFSDSLPGALKLIISTILIIPGCLKGRSMYNKIIGPNSEGILRWYENNITKVPLVVCAKSHIQRSKFDSDRELPVMCLKHILTKTQTKPKESVPVGIYGTTLPGFPMVYPSNDQDNLEAAIRIRMAFEREVDGAEWKKFEEFAKAELLSWKSKIDPLDLRPIEEVAAQQWPSSRAEEVLKAGREYLDDRDYVCELFVKGEAYLGKTPETYKPRMIWSRSLKFLYNFAPYFSAANKVIKTLLDGHEGTLYTSGSDPTKVGIFAQDMDVYSTIYEADVSNWDGSLHKGFLELEVFFIENVLDVLPQNWEWLKAGWFRVEGTGHGLHYIADGGRRSRDLWTSSFNSIINVLLVLYTSKTSLGPGIKILVNGDDNLVASNLKINTLGVVETYKKLGMVLELIVRPTVEDSTFCSGRFWSVGGQLIWGNMPFRTLSKFGLNHGNHPPRKFQSLIYGTAKGLLGSAGHVPVIGAFLRAICESAEELNLTAYAPLSDDKYKISGGMSTYPLYDTYLQFAAIYGMSVDSILALEEAIENCVDIRSFPYQWMDEDLLKGALIDVGAHRSVDSFESAFENLMTGETSRWTEICVTIPRQEEILKLENAKRVGLVRSALDFAAQEVALGSPGYVRLLHVLFTIISYINLEAGIAVHSAWNSMVLKQNTRNLPMCARGKQKKGPQKKKKPTQRGNQNRPALSSVLKDLARAGLIGSGAALGGYLGGAPGAMIGRQLGAGVSKYVGTGDYTVTDNTLLAPRKGAVFGNGGRAVRITHKEYLGDIIGSTAFTSRIFYLNPGLESTFPWLSPIAGRYQEYSIVGMVPEFHSTSATALNSTNTALGTIMMTTQYNPLRPAFSSKMECENYQYSTSGPPSQDQMHPIECASGEAPLDHQYIRTGAVPAGEDARFYDYAYLQVSTVGMQAAANIGELWISYDIELYKPAIDSGQLDGLYSSISNGAYTTASNVLGSVQTTPYGNLPMEITATAGGWDSIVIDPSITAGRFVVVISWVGGVAAALSYPGLTATNATLQNFFLLRASSSISSPINGVSSTRASIMACYTIDGYSSAGTKIVVGVAGTLPTTPTTVDIQVFGIKLENYPY